MGFTFLLKGRIWLPELPACSEESLTGAMGQAKCPTWVRTVGKLGQPCCFGTILHGKERGGLKVSPLPLGKDLRKEGGRDNLPEVSRGGRASSGCMWLQAWGTARVGASFPGSIPPSPQEHPSHLYPVDSVLQGADSLLQLPHGGRLVGRVAHGAGARGGAEPGGGGGRSGGGAPQAALAAAELAGELPDGLLVHADPLLLLQRRAAQLGRRAPQRQQLLGTGGAAGGGAGAGGRALGAQRGADEAAEERRPPGQARPGAGQRLGGAVQRSQPLVGGGQEGGGGRVIVGGGGGRGGAGRVDAGDDADDGPEESQHARRQQHRQKLQGGSGVGGPSPRTARKQSGRGWRGGRTAGGMDEQPGGSWRGRTVPAAAPAPGPRRAAPRLYVPGGAARTAPRRPRRRPRPGPGYAPLSDPPSR